MSKKLEATQVDETKIETVGSVLRDPMFLFLVAIMASSNCLLLFISIGNYWPSVCERVDMMLYGLIGGMYTVSIVSTTLVLSWILIDDCSWFFKSSLLYFTAFLFIICGTHYLYIYFRQENCDSFDIPSSRMSNATGKVLNKTRFDDGNLILSRNGTFLNSDNNKYLTLRDISPNSSVMQNSEYTCYFTINVEHISAWTPILIVLLIFLGVIYCMAATYLLIALDED